MMAAEEVADVRGLRIQRKRVIPVNMHAKLSDYIGQVFECKADSPHYSPRSVGNAYGSLARDPEAKCLWLKTRVMSCPPPGAADM